MGLYMIVVVFVLFIYLIVIYGGLVVFMVRCNFIEFFKGFVFVMIVGFSILSSNVMFLILMNVV